jgi:hypothetical protein
MDKNDPDSDQDESVALEQGRAGMFHREISRRYDRGRSPAQLHYLIQNTIRYFHPDKRYDKCLPSMMA